jgi:polysaccharide deacetylase 2 family uncharacterized protein YibQ
MASMRYYAVMLFRVLAVCIVMPGLVNAGTIVKHSGTAYIAIIVDDLGHDIRNGQRALRLPGPIACAILPHTKNGRMLAAGAHNKNKEVLLHQPMQSLGQEDPGPGKLVSGMPGLEIALTIKTNLKSVPYSTGINNHMGSLLTQSPREMAAVMATLQNHGNLFFIDSLTTSGSIAADMAALFDIPFLTRNIFLDSDRNEKAINKQFDRLLEIARRQGTGLAIGHPYDQTLAMLEKRLPLLAANGVKLVSVSELIKRLQEQKK